MLLVLLAALVAAVVGSDARLWSERFEETRSPAAFTDGTVDIAAWVPIVCRLAAPTLCDGAAFDDAAGAESPLAF